MKRQVLVVVVVVLLLAVGTSQVIAQSELTLEILAERLGLVSDRVSIIESRLTPNAHVTTKGNCLLGISGRLHPASVLSYMDKYSRESIPDFELLDVYHLVESEPSGSTAVGFMVRVDNYPAERFRFIYEHWDGCTYLSSSEWQSVDYEGNIVDE